MIELAKQNALALSAGAAPSSSWAKAFPVGNAQCSAGCTRGLPHLFRATANPTEVIIAETEQGCGILGVIDGFKSQGVEGPEEIAA